MGYLVLNALNNLLQELSSDSSQHVRSALASVIMGMAPLLGKVRISYIGLALVTKAGGLEDLPACHALYYSGLFIFIWLISYLVFAWRVTFNLFRFTVVLAMLDIPILSTAIRMHVGLIACIVIQLHFTVCVGCNNWAASSNISLSFEGWISRCAPQYHQQAWSSESGVLCLKDLTWIFYVTCCTY